jgi:chaperonin GroES
MSFSIKPLEDRIIILPIAADEVTSFGLVIPESAKEKPQEAEVIALGPGRIDDNGNRIPLDIAVGDRVFFSKYGGTELKVEGKAYLVVSARDILAIAEPKA